MDDQALADGQNSSLAEGRALLSHRRIDWSIIPSVSAPSPFNLIWIDQKEFDGAALPRPLRHWWDGLSDDEKHQLFCSA